MRYLQQMADMRNLPDQGDGIDMLDPRRRVCGKSNPLDLGGLWPVYKGMADPPY